jgi:hypothetical protein
MSWWEDIFVKRAQDWTFGQLRGEQVPLEMQETQDVIAEKHYLSIDVCSARVVNVRKLTTSFYGVVHSFVSLGHQSGQPASFQTISTPSELKKIDPKRLDRVISENIPLLGQVPYRGGRVQFSLGLFSVKESDLAGPYLNLLQDIASKAGISVVSSALPFVDTIKKGLDNILGNSDDSILETGYSTAFTEPVKTGLFVIMRAPAAENVLPKLRLEKDTFRLVGKETGLPLSDYPYIVFRIMRSDQRNDWHSLPYLMKTYNDLQTAVRNRDYDGVEKKFLPAFITAAYMSDDLLFDDGERIGKLVEERTRKAMGATKVSMVDGEALPPLKSYQLY